MINANAAIGAIRKERAHWSRQLKTDYIAGVMKGLEIARRILEVMAINAQGKRFHFYERKAIRAA